MVVYEILHNSKTRVQDDELVFKLNNNDKKFIILSMDDESKDTKVTPPSETNHVETIENRYLQQGPLQKFLQNKFVPPIIATVVLILLISTGIFMAQKTEREVNNIKPTPTQAPATFPETYNQNIEEWAEYVNSQHNYVVKYPEDIFILSNVDQYEHVVQFKYKFEPANRPWSPTLDIIVNYSYAERKWENCTNRRVDENRIYPLHNVNVSFEDVVIEGLTACRQDIDSDEYFIFETFLQKDDEIYTISLNKDHHKTEFTRLYDQIISTFQFIPPTPTPSPYVEPTPIILEGDPPFSIDLPSGWEHQRLQGIDSSVGRFIGPGDVILRYDYGLYSNSLADEDDPDHNINYETIDGKRAKIVTPKQVGDGTTGVYFENVESFDGYDYDSIKLQINGQNLSEAQQDQVLNMFRTIRFED